MKLCQNASLCHLQKGVPRKPFVDIMLRFLTWFSNISAFWAHPIRCCVWNKPFCARFPPQFSFTNALVGLRQDTCRPSGVVQKPLHCVLIMSGRVAYIFVATCAKARAQDGQRLDLNKDGKQLKCTSEQAHDSKFDNDQWHQWPSIR